MSAPNDSLISEAYDVLGELQNITAAFVCGANAGAEDAEAFLLRREALTARLEQLDEALGSCFADATAEAGKRTFQEYLARRNEVLSDVLAKDREIIRIAEGLLTGISGEMSALQAGKQAMNGYRQGGISGVVVNRTA